MIDPAVLWRVALSGFGAALALFFAISLASDAARGAHQRVLAVFCAAFAATQVGDIATLSMAVGAPPWAGNVADPAFLLLAPMLHGYVWAFTQGRALPAGMLAAAVAPAAGALIWVLLRIASGAPGDHAAPDDDFMPTAYTVAFVAVALIQLPLYAALAWRAVSRHGQRLRAVLSAPEAVSALDLHWLRSLMLAASAAALVWVLGLWIQHPAWRWLEALLPPALVLALGLRARWQSAMPESAEPAAPLAGTTDLADRLDSPRPPAGPGPGPATEPAGTADATESAEPGGRYARSGLSPARRAELARRLDDFMREERAFLEGDLTLQSLAARCGVPAHHCSQVLNQELGSSFFDYVNRLRVEEAQRCLRDPAYDAQTVLDIGLASGFNSKAAFNASFKRLAGCTPSAYRQGR